MKKPQPPAATVFRWLRDNGHNLAALTGQDTRALAAAVQVVALYNACDSEAEDFALTAFRGCVLSMQPHTRELAYHAVAHVGDWSFRAIMWERSGLEPLPHVGRCKFE